MSQELVARAVASMGVEIVDVFCKLVGSAGWSAGIVPFARVKLRESEVDLVLASMLDADGVDQSRGLRLALIEHPELRNRLFEHASLVALALDHAQVNWRWGAVRVRRLLDGGSRAGLELGADAPPAHPLMLLDSPTIVPPAVDALRATAGAHGARASAVPPLPTTAPAPPPAFGASSFPTAPPASMRDPNEVDAPMSRILEDQSMQVLPGYVSLDASPGYQPPSPALQQTELRQTMHRAQSLVGAKQDAFVRAIMGASAIQLIPRERAIEFVVAGQRLRFGCDQIASYLASTNTWTWGWSTERFTPMVRAQSRKLRETGANWGLEALTAARLHAPPDLAFKLGVTSAWIMGADACHFVRGDPAGEIVVAIYGVR